MPGTERTEERVHGPRPRASFWEGKSWYHEQNSGTAASEQIILKFFVSPIKLVREQDLRLKREE